MKLILTILIALSLFPAIGQTTRVATSTATSNPLVYTQAGVDTLVNRLNRAVTTLQSQVRLLQSQASRDSANIAALQSSVATLQKQVSGDTVFFDSFFIVKGKNISLNVDSVLKRVYPFTSKIISDGVSIYSNQIKNIQSLQDSLQKALDANTANDLIDRTWIDKVKKITFNL